MSGSSGVLSPARSPSNQGTPDDCEDQSASRSKAMAEAKGASKCVRVLTVLAYVLSVSMAAILLSLYYVFLWNPHRSDAPMALRDDAETADDEFGNVSRVEKPTTLPFQQETYFTENNTIEDTPNLVNGSTVNDTDILPTSTVQQNTSSSSISKMNTMPTQIISNSSQNKKPPTSQVLFYFQILLLIINSFQKVISSDIRLKT